MAVAQVRDQMGLNREGSRDAEAPRDTVEVYADFEEPEGFFGLIAYLAYAEKQLAKSSEWTREATRTQGVKHAFPWRYIDTSHIHATGFEPETFAFTVDEHRILDLLTGHTLYNQTSVVLRELVQNSLDAVRLQRLIGGREGRGAERGRVSIAWDSENRRLTVRDTGTGMSQYIIENHLLRVGASRYQDAEFQRDYPEFSPISRFGIGVLSAFMIADEVDVITVSPDDEDGRHLALRSLHGKYLIRHLDKETDPEAARLAPHGTEINLQLRPSARLDDVLQAVRYWIVFPDCDVEVMIDGGEPVSIGYAEPHEMVDAFIAKEGFSDHRSIRVVQREHSGVTLAYACAWSESF